MPFYCPIPPGSTPEYETSHLTECTWHPPPSWRRIRQTSQVSAPNLRSIVHKQYFTQWPILKQIKRFRPLLSIASSPAKAYYQSSPLQFRTAPKFTTATNSKTILRAELRWQTRFIREDRTMPLPNLTRTNTARLYHTLGNNMAG